MTSTSATDRGTPRRLVGTPLQVAIHAVLASCSLVLVAGCADSRTPSATDPTVLTIDGKVCGLLEAASVESTIGIDDFTADGSGIGPLPGPGKVRDVTCHVGFADGQHAQELLSLDAGDPYDQAMWRRWRDRLASTFREHVADARVVAGAQCTKPAVIEKMGAGFACNSDQRTYLDVLLAHREITLTLTASQTGSPRARISAALALVEQADASLTAHDRAAG